MPYIPVTVVNSGGGGGGDFTFIQEIVAPAGGSATIDFTSIPATYRDLWITWVAQTENAAAQNLNARLNNDSAANYAFAQVDIQAGGTSVLGGQTEGLVGVLAATGDVNPCMGEIFIGKYTGTTWTKVMRGVCNGFYSAANRQTIQQTFWTASPAAVDRITIFAASDIKEGSVFTLYGIG